MKKTLLKPLVMATLLVGISAGLVVADSHARSPGAQAARADINKTLGFVPGFLDSLPDAAPRCPVA